MAARGRGYSNAKRSGKYRSGFEAGVAKQLKKMGAPVKHEPCYIPYVVESLYLPDFELVKDRDYIEVKGRFTPRDRKILMAVKKQHPDITIRLLFMEDKWLNKNRKTRYSEWATKNGFPWAVGEVPREWIP